MDFKELYKLLDGAITKEPVDVIASSDNFNTFIFNRYLSFHSEFNPILLSRTVNRVNWLPDSEDEYIAWKGIRASLPKLPRRFIDYVKKPAVVATQELEVSEDWIREEALLNECSKREIRDLILWKTKQKEKDCSTK